MTTTIRLPMTCPYCVRPQIVADDYGEQSKLRVHNCEKCGESFYYIMVASNADSPAQHVAMTSRMLDAVNDALGDVASRYSTIGMLPPPTNLA